MIELSNAGNR